jgi:hypothetical protein
MAKVLLHGECLKMGPGKNIREFPLIQIGILLSISKSERNSRISFEHF